MSLQEEIADLLKAGRDALNAARYAESEARAANPSWNPFDWGVNSLRRSRRDIHTGERRAKLDIDRYVKNGKGTVNEIFDFVVRKAPDGLERGFGNLTVNPNVLTEVAKHNNRDEAVRNIAAIMQYTNSSIGLEKVGGKTVSYLSKTAPSERYLISQAENAYDIIADPGEMERIANKALYIDIETSGLDEQASVWQVAMKRGDETKAEDIRMRSHLMDRGAYSSDGRITNFAGHMEDIEGVKGEVDRLTGFRRTLKRMDEAEAIVGQNVSFDLEKLFRDMARYKGADDKYDELFTRVHKKVFEDGGIRIVDTRQLASLRLGGIIPSAKEELTGGFKTMSQENIALQTNILEQMQERLSTEEWNIFEEALKQSGLHDAGVDIQVTEQIFRSAISGELSRIDYTTLGADVLSALKASAIVPTATKLDYGSAGKMTPLEALMRGTGQIEDYVYAQGSERSILRAGAFYDWQQLASQAGMTEEILREKAERTGVSGFLDPTYARDFNLGDQEASMAEIVGRARTSGAKTVQELFREASTPFANLSQPERQVTSMLTSGNQVGTRLQTRVTSTTRGAAGGMYMQAYDGINYKDYRNVAISPEILQRYEKRTKTRIGQTFEADGKVRRVARISTVAPREDTARATVVLDAFESEDAARKFVGEIQGMYDELAALDEITDPADRKLFNMLDNIDFAQFESELVSKHKYGLQVGQYLGENVEGAVNVLDQLFPGRDIETTKMGTILEGLDIGEGGEIRTTAALFDVGARVDEVRSNVEGAFSAMHDLEKRMASGWNYLEAQVLSDSGTRRLSHFVLGNKKLVNKGLAGAAGLAAMLFLASDNKKDQRLEEPFEVSGYEGASDYQKYKASIGEYAEPGFQSMPMSTRDPLEMSGAVQYLHDTKTRRHQMGANKNAHLFGL